MTATTEPPALTRRQQDVLDFIWGYWARHVQPPTVRDVCEFLGSDSPNAAAGHLRALEAKGAIVREGGVARGIWPAGLKELVRPVLAARQQGVTS